ncbi:hypothetical protein KBD75_04830 [Candidatus Woesebacteria bacterium]|nr:hypothetical protein [Candidatus Woesebacteria bacterium]
MNQNDTIWFLDKIHKYFKLRLSADQLHSVTSVPLSVFQQITHDIQASVDLYNDVPQKLKDLGISLDTLINTIHLKTIYKQALPSYQLVVSEIKNNKPLTHKIFSVIRDSNYFQEVFQIENPSHLVANLMTLLYRGYVLARYPELIDAEAQISSVLEEMSATRYILGQDSIHFQATRHWMLDWEGEGFSQELCRLIS